MQNAYEELTGILEDLIDVLKNQATEIDNIFTRFGQVAGHVPEIQRLSLIEVELTALKVRVKEMREELRSRPA